jgi:predicted RNA binding protein YcfA (HicA-like mRNA interferase family)
VASTRPHLWTFPADPAAPYGTGVPPKVRDLIADLRAAGFVDRGGKGSHRNFAHLETRLRVTISGAPGDDAKPYQIHAVRRAIEESKA